LRDLAGDEVQQRNILDDEIGRLAAHRLIDAFGQIFFIERVSMTTPGTQ
jgi:hypothetical protein